MRPKNTFQIARERRNNDPLRESDSQTIISWTFLRLLETPGGLKIDKTLELFFAQEKDCPLTL